MDFGGDFDASLDPWGPLKIPPKPHPKYHQISIDFLIDFRPPFGASLRSKIGIEIPLKTGGILRAPQCPQERHKLSSRLDEAAILTCPPDGFLT